MPKHLNKGIRRASKDLSPSPESSLGLLDIQKQLRHSHHYFSVSVIEQSQLLHLLQPGEEFATSVGQFWETLLPLMMTSLEAWTVIFPEPLRVMLAPLIVMSPLLLRMMLALPEVSVI